MTHYLRRSFSMIQIISMFEALKGLLALLAGVGVLSLFHRDLHQIALSIIGHYGLNEHSHFTAIFLNWTDVIQNQNKLQLAIFAIAYIVLRFTEAYGLWFERAWAEWLAAISGGIYLPLEVIHLFKHPVLSSILVLCGNALMVAYLVWQLVQRQQQQKKSQQFSNQL